MTAGPGDHRFDPRWLTVALAALLSDRTSVEPVSVGLQVGNVVLTVGLDDTGPQVSLGADPAQDPGTVLSAAPDVVLGLAAGALSVEQAVARGELRGDARPLAAVFDPPGGEQAASTAERPGVR